MTEEEEEAEPEPEDLIWDPILQTWVPDEGKWW
jgi:hypothetical protein